MCDPDGMPIQVEIESFEIGGVIGDRFEDVAVEAMASQVPNERSMAFESCEAFAAKFSDRHLPPYVWSKQTLPETTDVNKHSGTSWTITVKEE